MAGPTGVAIGPVYWLTAEGVKETVCFTHQTAWMFRESMHMYTEDLYMQRGTLNLRHKCTSSCASWEAIHEKDLPKEILLYRMLKDE